MKIVIAPGVVVNDIGKLLYNLPYEADQVA